MHPEGQNDNGAHKQQEHIQQPLELQYLSIVTMELELKTALNSGMNTGPAAQMARKESGLAHTKRQSEAQSRAQAGVGSPRNEEP